MNSGLRRRRREVTYSPRVKSSSYLSTSRPIPFHHPVYNNHHASGSNHATYREPPPNYSRVNYIRSTGSADSSYFGPPPLPRRYTNEGTSRSQQPYVSNVRAETNIGRYYNDRKPYREKRTRGPLQRSPPNHHQIKSSTYPPVSRRNSSVSSMYKSRIPLSDVRMHQRHHDEQEPYLRKQFRFDRKHINPERYDIRYPPRRKKKRESSPSFKTAETEKTNKLSTEKPKIIEKSYVNETRNATEPELCSAQTETDKEISKMDESSVVAFTTKKKDQKEENACSSSTGFISDPPINLVQVTPEYREKIQRSLRTKSIEGTDDAAPEFPNSLPRTCSSKHRTEDFQVNESENGVLVGNEDNIMDNDHQLTETTTRLGFVENEVETSSPVTPLDTKQMLVLTPESSSKTCSVHSEKSETVLTDDESMTDIEQIEDSFENYQTRRTASPPVEESSSLDYTNNDVVAAEIEQSSSKEEQNSTEGRVSSSFTSNNELRESRIDEALFPLFYGCRFVDRYTKLNKISEGTYGAVYRAKNKETGEIVALKHIKYHERVWEEGFPLTSLREISILLQLNNDHIVRVHEIVVDSVNPNQVFMVMEYIEHEIKVLLDCDRPQFSLSERKSLVLQLLQAITYMHKHWVMHRDLKTSNLLYSNKGVLKICDFGMARKFGDPILPYTQNIVTLWYRAPELLLGTTEYTEAVDIWSAGCIMGEIFLRRPLFDATNEADALDKIFKLCGTPTEKSWPSFQELPVVKVHNIEFAKHSPTWRRVFPAPRAHITETAALSENGLDLLKSLLTPDPSLRISLEDALKHPFFSEKPLPQRRHLMPTAPDSNTKVHDSRHASNTIKDALVHDKMTERFGRRVNAQQYLSELEHHVGQARP